MYGTLILFAFMFAYVVWDADSKTQKVIGLFLLWIWSVMSGFLLFGDLLVRYT
jgi:hypothetical protein